MSGYCRERVHNTKRKSRGAGKGVGGIGGRLGEGSEGSGRAEIIGIRGKMEEKGDIIAPTSYRALCFAPKCADTASMMIKEAIEP